MSPPAAPAAICFPPRRLPPRSPSAAFAVDLATDDRALKYGADFPARAIHAIPSATPTNAGLARKARRRADARRAASRRSGAAARRCPRVVVGFGGYPTVPPLLAASLLGLPSVLHEQNAVMGRANRFLAAARALIATGFPELKGVAAALAPRRATPAIPSARPCSRRRKPPYPDFGDGRLRVLVTGRIARRAGDGRCRAGGAGAADAGRARRGFA